jgi:GntR family transcriptional regulator, galactonate operon transcriptional repressor
MLRNAMNRVRVMSCARAHAPCKAVLRCYRVTMSNLPRRKTYQRRNLHGQVVHEVALRILRGQFAEGEPLPNETELTDQLQVSRTVLREATKVLAAKGLVESRTRAGTRVRSRAEWNRLDPDVLAWEYEASPSERYLDTLTELRMAIEPYACELAAQRASRRQVAALEKAFEDMAASVDDDAAYIEADMRFHSGILAAAQNELLDYLHNTVLGMLISSRRITTQRPGSSEGALPLHKNVLDAIACGQSDLAFAAMRSLIHTASADIHFVLHRTGSSKRAQPARARKAARSRNSR